MSEEERPGPVPCEVNCPEDLALLLRRFDEMAEWEIAKLKGVLALARERLIAGHPKFGAAWKDRDNLREEMEERADAFNYRLFAHLQEYGEDRPI